MKPLVMNKVQKDMEGLRGQGSTKRRRGPFFYGWVIVAVSCLAEFIFAIGTSYVFGIFLKPMSTEFGWTRAATAAGLSLGRIMGALVGPVIGYLVDKKHGARLLMVGGAVAVGAGLMAFSRVQALWQFYLIYCIVGVLGLAEIGGLIAPTVVAKWFVRRRGRAVGLTMSVGMLGAATFATVSERLISSVGWRDAWVILGLLMWVILTPPAALFMRRRPEDMGLRPDGEEVETQNESVTQPAAPGSVSSASEGEPVWTLRQVMKTTTFWLTVTAFTVAGVALGGVIMHQASYVTDMGFSEAIAAASVSTLAVGSALGKLFWGFLTEKVHVRYSAIACFTSAAIIIGILMGARSVPLLFFSAFMYGLTMAGHAVLTTLVYANYFGRTSLGAIRGVVQAFTLTSLAAGPVFSGYIYDITESYQLAFTVFLTVWLVGALLMFLAKPPRAPDAQGRLAY